MKESNMSRRRFLLSSLAGFGAVAASGAASALPASRTKEYASHEDACNEAWRLIEEDGACRAIVSGRAIVSVEHGRGVGPLMRLMASNPSLLDGTVMVDSVVGRAAAAIAVKGGVKKVLARTASEGAKSVLARGGVALEAKVVVPGIMNRDLTGACPVEAATAGLESPDEIIAATARTLDALRNSAKAGVS